MTRRNPPRSKQRNVRQPAAAAPAFDLLKLKLMDQLARATLRQLDFPAANPPRRSRV